MSKDHVSKNSTARKGLKLLLAPSSPLCSDWSKGAHSRPPTVIPSHSRDSKGDYLCVYSVRFKSNIIIIFEFCEYTLIRLPGYCLLLEYPGDSSAFIEGAYLPTLPL